MAKLNLLDRLARGDVLVSDGGTGTNLQKIGLPPGSAAEAWVLKQPESILALSRSFIDAGSDIILTCTFGATRIRLESANLRDQFEEVNRKAVEISRAAVGDSQVLVGGSIGPTGHMLAPLGTLSVEEAEENFTQQASILVDSGVDLIVIETQFDIGEATAAIRGVRSVDASIPLVCSFSFDRGARTMMGTTPANMVDVIGSMDVDMLGINCGRSLNENLDALIQLNQVSQKPIWFKPNAGLPEVGDDGSPTYSISPEEMGALVPVWMESGARVIGGCCGTSPEHLEQIAKIVHV